MISPITTKRSTASCRFSTPGLKITVFDFKSQEDAPSLDMSAAASEANGGGEATTGGEAVGETVSVGGGEAKFQCSGMIL